MAEPIAMPRLGWTMEEGTLVEWLKADGDAVEAGAHCRAPGCARGPRGATGVRIFEPDS